MMTRSTAKVTCETIRKCFGVDLIRAQLKLCPKQTPAHGLCSQMVACALCATRIPTTHFVHLSSLRCFLSQIQFLLQFVNSHGLMAIHLSFSQPTPARGDFFLVCFAMRSMSRDELWHFFRK